MNVLSLFDGMACGLVALKRAGIRVNNYFASEIDKYAIQIAMKNHPEIIQLGDINNYESWDLPKIDLIIGGSPCQGFSFAGKQLNFDDERSALFFKVVEILWQHKENNPDIKFLLENVKMKKEYQDAISELLEVEPVLINSALVSAQNRNRLYWCNWKVEQPQDKDILLKDIIEGIGVLKNRGEWRLKTDKSNCIDYNYHKGVDNHGQRTMIFIRGIEKGRRIFDGKNLSRNFREGSRIYSEKGKAATLTGKTKGNQGGYTGLYEIKNNVRKLTPIECERLQTLDDNYTEVLDVELYCMYIIQKTLNNNEVITCKKNVKFQDAKEKRKQSDTENSVFYITSDSKLQEALTKESLTTSQKKNVSIAIEKLGRKAEGREECAIGIIKIGSDTEIHYTPIKSGSNLVQEDIKNELMVKIGTELKWKITLEENLKELKRFTMLILIKLITELRIFSYVKTKANIHFCINNLRRLPGNLLKVELSGLKMENIILCSNTQRYKMIGNGWTIDVIKHIFESMTCKDP